MTRHAERVANKIISLARARGLEPAFSDSFVLVTPGGRWLALKLDLASRRVEPYLSRAFESQVAMGLGRRFYSLETEKGAYLVALLSESVKDPQLIERPISKPGTMQLGIGMRGNEIEETWQGLGHVLIAGMTGSGKSVFLRNMVTQAIEDEIRLFLVDADEMTFPQLAGNPLLGAEIGNLATAADVMKAVLAEIPERQRMIYEADPNAEGYWQLSTEVRRSFPPILVAVDEANGLVSALGGPTGSFADSLKQVAWRGRKFGIILTVAGQTFEKAVVGPMRDQLQTKLCFKVANSTVSRVVLGRNGAEKIKRPGRALTNRWGVIQTYFVQGFEPQSPTIPQTLRDLVVTLAEHYNGEATFSALSSEGLSRGDATKAREQLESFGLAFVDTTDKNKMKLTEWALETVLTDEMTRSANTTNTTNTDGVS